MTNTIAPNENTTPAPAEVAQIQWPAGDVKVPLERPDNFGPPDVNSSPYAPWPVGKVGEQKD